MGCIGILKDWLLHAVSTTLDDGKDRLSLDCVQDHALPVDIYRQMALDAYEGEQRLNHTASNREHVWRLLQGGELIAPVPPLPPTRDASGAGFEAGACSRDRSLACGCSTRDKWRGSCSPTTSQKDPRTQKDRGESRRHRRTGKHSPGRGRGDASRHPTQTGPKEESRRRGFIRIRRPRTTGFD